MTCHGIVWCIVCRVWFGYGMAWHNRNIVLHGMVGV